jgi:hypothetical protein
MEYTDHLRQLRRHDSTLGDQFAGFRSLRQVLDWMSERGLASAKVDVIAQDEYSHDFLVPLPDSRYVAFGMT